MNSESSNQPLSLSRSVNSGNLRIDGLALTSGQTELISEYLLYIYVNEQLAGKVVCTPSDLPELITGRLMTENGIDPGSIDSIHIAGRQGTARVFVDPKAWENTSRSEADEVPTCCTDNEILIRANMGGTELIPLPEHRITPEQIAVMHRAISDRLEEDTKLHKATRSSHSCFVIRDGVLIYEAEDIGRHNAVDKAVGFIYRNGIDPSQIALFTTGRMPVDMVRKAVRARIPVLISRQQPSAQGTELAGAYGLTLLGNLRKDHITIYN